jgi:hypothetical protein
VSSFEFVFSLFGLLLGFSLAEVLGGFARGLKRRGSHRLGLLTPMLSIFLLYDISTFWITAYRIRDSIPVHIGSLIGGLVVTGLYYFATVLVWPEEGDGAAWDDLDGWMLAHKRQVLLSVFACNVMSVTAAISLAPQTFNLDAVQWALLSIYFAGVLAGALARGRKATIAALGLLLALYALDLFVNVTGG